MPARIFPLKPPGNGKGSQVYRPACTRVSQETGSAAYINHVPGGERRRSEMSAVSGRLMAVFLLRASAFRKCLTLAAFLFLAHFLFTTPARAVVVRGVVTDPLGKPVPGARIQLIQGQKAVAVGIAGVDGAYEIRSTEAGRFVLLTSSAAYFPGISQDFYGGSTDQITQNIVLETSSVKEEVTVTATGVPTPIEQASAAVTLIPESDLVTKVGVADALRQSPGVDVVQTGQMGGVASLFVRGGNSTANQVLRSEED